MVLKNNYLNNVIELQDNDDDSTHNNERETKFKKLTGVAASLSSGQTNSGNKLLKKEVKKTHRRPILHFQNY